jgi:hypothetical protein
MLSYRERLRVAWELVWPGAAIEAGWAVFQFGSGVQSSTVETIYLMAGFFLISPWIIRRAVRVPYPGFRFLTVNDPEGIVRPMAYGQSMRVFWLLGWRTLALSILALIPVSLVAGNLLGLPLAGIGEALSGSRIANSLGLAAVDVVTTFAFFPLLFPGLLRKRFRGFHLQVKRQN